MNDKIPPTPEALKEAFSPSESIITDIEFNQTKLTNIALKASRLAKLLNHFEMRQILQYEAGGYPLPQKGFSKETWALLVFAGRTYEQKEKTEVKTYAYAESIEQLENQIEVGKIRLESARDRDISVSSANPSQYVMTPAGNLLERNNIQGVINLAITRLASRRTFIYQYASNWYYDLKYSGIVQDVFSSVRQYVDKNIGELIPSAIQKFTAVYDNLTSENPEDWSNAVHSCRRILQELADVVYQAREDRISAGKKIQLGPDNYINRLVCFAEEKSTSGRFKELIGSHLGFLGDRLDAVFQATQKGSHSDVTKEEANRYVIYTYMLVGDILALHKNRSS